MHLFGIMSFFTGIAGIGVSSRLIANDLKFGARLDRVLRPCGQASRDLVVDVVFTAIVANLRWHVFDENRATASF